MSLGCGFIKPYECFDSNCVIVPEACKRQLAFVYGQGVTNGRPQACWPPLPGRIVSGPAAATFAGVRLPLPLIGSKELCLQLRIARNDDRVAAVVLRLDTPGII